MKFGESRPGVVRSLHCILNSVSNYECCRLLDVCLSVGLDTPCASLLGHVMQARDTVRVMFDIYKTDVPLPNLHVAPENNGYNKNVQILPYTPVGAMLADGDR